MPIKKGLVSGPDFDRVVSAFARDRQVTREQGWGADNLVLKVNGKIFAMLNKGRLVVKLPRQRVDALVREGGTHFDAGRGRPMKEWVVVGPGRKDWIELAKEAYRFVKAGKS